MSFRIPSHFCSKVFYLSPNLSSTQTLLHLSHSFPSLGKSFSKTFSFFSSANTSSIPTKKIGRVKLHLKTSPTSYLKQSRLIHPDAGHLSFAGMVGEAKACARLEQQIALLPDKSDRVNELVDALKKPAVSVINDQELLYALEALRQGKMTSQQMGTQGIFLSVYKLHKTHSDEIESFSLFSEEGSPKQQAWRMIKASLGGILNDEEMAQFVDKTKLLPLSEQRFLLIPFAFIRHSSQIYPECSNIEKNGVRQFINQFINLFSVFTLSNQQFLMIPSIGILQSFLDVFGGVNSVKINPIFGLSSLSKLRLNGLKSQRDMSIPSPWATLPILADTHPAPAYDFPYHDFYHAFVVSCICPSIRHLCIALADALDIYSLQASFAEFRELRVVEQIYTLKNLLVDMEFGQTRFYRCALKLTPKSMEGISEDDVFWADLIKLIFEWKKLYHIHPSVMQKTMELMALTIKRHNAQTKNPLNVRVLKIFNLNLFEEQALFPNQKNSQIQLFNSYYCQNFYPDLKIGKLFSQIYFHL